MCGSGVCEELQFSYILNFLHTSYEIMQVLFALSSIRILISRRKECGSYEKIKLIDLEWLGTGRIESVSH